MKNRQRYFNFSKILFHKMAIVSRQNVLNFNRMHAFYLYRRSKYFIISNKSYSSNSIFYNLRTKLWTKCCFMMQRCQNKIGVAQYSAMLLSTRFILTICQFFQMRYIYLCQKRRKSYRPVKFK